MLRPSRAFTGGFETRPYVRVNDYTGARKH